MESRFVAILENLDRIATPDDYLAWVGNDLREFLPHEVFACGMGRVHGTRLVPAAVFSANFPCDYSAYLHSADGRDCLRALVRCLASGDVFLLDRSGSNAEAHRDNPWARHLASGGIENVAIHGVLEFSHHGASWFSFHRIPEPLGERQRRLLRLCVPHLHMALLRILRKPAPATRAKASSRTLTARERDVLAWVCAGKTSAEVAAIHGVALSTVRNQIQSILVKLRVNTRAQAAAKAMREGLVTS